MNSEQYMDDPIFDAYAPKIREWDERTKVSPEIFPGCQLRKDAEAQTPELAWTVLVASVDSLATLLKLHEHESEEFHEMATFVIARAPILAASTAHWLLSPGKYHRRISRGLSLLESNLTNIESFSAPLADDNDDATEQLEVEIKRERTRIAEQLKKLGLEPKEKPADTWIVGDVSRTLEKDGRCSHAQVLGLWRLCSGHAHAMRWAAKMPKPENPYTAMNDLMGVGVALTNAAFDLWDERTRVAQ